MEEWQADRRQFERWLLAKGGDNREELERLKKALPVILDECVTERQRKFMIHRFVEQKNGREISEMYGVNPSTVSRVIHAGMNNVYRYIKFASPRYMNAEQAKVNLAKGTKYRKRKKVNEDG
jgi:DNA-directed RNA polymerase specialized sigma subunit